MSFRRVLLVALSAISLDASAFAQATKGAPAATGVVPIIKSIVPPGIMRGETVTWTVTGQGLAKCNEVILSGRGLEVVEIQPKDENSLVLIVKAEPDAEPGYRDVRVVGPDGISNLRTIRVDDLKQVDEKEPNDDPAKASEIAPGIAVWGTLIPRDLDHFRLKAKRGERLTIEVEAQRLGTAISPVLSILAENGASLMLARESRGTERDCRMSFTAPQDATYIVRLHDNIYAGSDAATYRLRIETAPFGTAIFPLGGRAGQPLVVSASGGTLTAPLQKTIVLPNEPGAIIDPGAFESPHGSLVVPGKIVISDGIEVMEQPQGQSTSLPQGATANGRIARRDEVDRYVIPVKKGELIRLKIRAADLGSWLDSVLAVVDEKGTILAENDEPTTNNGNRGNGTFFGLNTDSPDSSLDYEAKADGNLLVEVTDRYGDGGPEFTYRLSAATAQPDFEVNLLVGAAVGQVPGAAQNRVTTGVGAFGVYNLKPGSVIPINFLINAQGRPGPVKVTIEGLPPGITSEPVEIKLDGPLVVTQPAKPNAPRPAQSQSLGGAIVLKVGSGADLMGTLGTFQVVATSLKSDVPIRRIGTATIALNPQQATPGTRIPSRSFSKFPLKITGDPGFSLVGPIAALVGPIPYSRLKATTIVGDLLAGGRLDVDLEFEPRLDAHTPVEVAGTINGQGFQVTPKSLTPTVTTGLEKSFRRIQLQVAATAATMAGVYNLNVLTKVGDYEPETRVVSITVRPLFVLRCTTENLTLVAGDSIRVPFTIDRASGMDRAIELRAVYLPAGIHVLKKQDVPMGGNSGYLDLGVTQSTKVIPRLDSLQVIGVTQVAKVEVSAKLSIPLKIEVKDSDH